MKDNYKFLFAIIVVMFLVTRLVGLGLIYHQDEYRWATIANPQFSSFGYESSHPPMTLFLLKNVGNIFGFDYLRIIPLVLSVLNLFLIYFISLKVSKSKTTALIAAGIFTASIYGLIASLQIDIDGAILPFFILATYYCYLYILEDQKSKLWMTLFGLAVVGGFLTKLSYLLFVGALFADQALRVYYSNNKSIKDFFSRLWPWLVGFLAIVGLFYYFYAVKFGRIITYAEHFSSLNFASRAYFDLLFKIFKSFVWLSPLLALPVLYGLFKKEILRKYQIWFAYLLINLIFYLVLFDFSTLTIERYFMFLIIPSILIGAEIIHNLLGTNRVSRKDYVFGTVIFLLFSVIVLWLPHEIVPLNPKEAYLDKVKSLDFRFLIPFTGGSGPSGFYFSALFIFMSWLIAAISLAGFPAFKKRRGFFLALFIVFGTGYNILFSNEYLRGSLYGSVDKVAQESIEYVNSNSDIGEVITYYDIGAYYLRLSGKYSSRFYTAPKRDYAPKIETYRGQYMIVDFPAIDKSGRYWPLIERCPLIKKFHDKKVDSYIFDCRNLK